MPFGTSFPGVLAAARQGAAWAWSGIYKDLAPQVLGYLRASGAADPEDLTGEVFLSLVRDIARFEGDEPNFRSWIFVIAHHRLLDDRRRRNRRPETLVAVDPGTDNRPGGNVEHEALESLGVDTVRRFIERCFPDQREVLLLRIIAELSLAEVAEVLGKTVGAVKALQHRGIAAVAREMSREGVTR
ncbi:MAG: sigma-70 family RNA polymerase sigma factor [Actinomycetota bacterium]